MAAARADQNAFYISEWARLQSNALTDPKERVGTAVRSRLNDGLDCFNLGGGNRSGLCPETHDVFDVRSGKNRQTIVPSQAAEQIAGEKRRFDRLDAIGVLTAFRIGRAEDLKSS